MGKFILVVVLFALVVYGIAWTIERRMAVARGEKPAPRGPKFGPRRPRGEIKQVAPDDDEDFLRWLDRKRRKDPDGPGDDGVPPEPV